MSDFGDKDIKEEENNHRQEDDENHRDDDEQRYDRTDRGDDENNEGNREGEGNEGEKKAEETTSLLIRNVPYGTRPDDLRELFSKYGEIKDIYIPMVRINARPTFSYLQLILR